MKLKIRDTAFESNPAEGTASIIRGDTATTYGNTIEAWNVFKDSALRPYEIKLRGELEDNGFNRWTGIKGDTPTESELYAMDLYQSIRRGGHNG